MSTSISVRTRFVFPGLLWKGFADPVSLPAVLVGLHVNSVYPGSALRPWFKFGEPGGAPAPEARAEVSQFLLDK